MVKKYSKLVTNVKNITPHKLRSTYGTNLYRKTGDIYLVAEEYLNKIAGYLKIIDDEIIKDEVIVQSGFTKYSVFFPKTTHVLYYML